MWGGIIALVVILCMLGVGIVVGLAFIPAYLAGKKGYSFGLFWLFGFFLIIPAIIVAAVIEPQATQQTVHSTYPPPQGEAGMHPSSGGKSGGEQLKQLEILKEQGFITEAEYETKKKEFVGF